MTHAPRTRCGPAVAAAIAAVAPAMALPAAHAAAQPSPAPRPPARQTIAVNLLGLPFGIVAGEYERAVGTGGLAVGLGATASLDGEFGGPSFNDRYTTDQRLASLQAKLKYYPSARGLRGLAVGLTAGVADARGTTFRYTGVLDTVTNGGLTYVQERRRAFRLRDTRPTVGSVLDYNFLIGRRQRFLVGLGVGARRVLGTADPVALAPDAPAAPAPVLDRTLFDGRLQVGFGF